MYQSRESVYLLKIVLRSMSAHHITDKNLTV